MLVLVRRVHEAIKIGDDIVVTVLGQNGNQIRLGVSAPSDITVHREEVFRRIYGDEHTDELVGDVANTVKSIQPKPAANEPMALEISPLKYGTVVNVPRDKKYGFIYTPGVEKNIFFHASNLTDCEFHDVEEGKEVRFRLMYAKQGYFAEEITVMD